ELPTLDRPQDENVDEGLRPGEDAEHRVCGQRRRMPFVSEADGLVEPDHAVASDLQRCTPVEPPAHIFLDDLTQAVEAFRYESARVHTGGHKHSSSQHGTCDIVV